MLWTTPESLRESLPAVNRTGDLVITADARIDNREELIQLLRLTDRISAEITDSELILAAYERWRKQCPERLLGDFAFAVWDARQQTLFCARDHFGVRPLYYHLSDRTFVFATEIRALFCLREVPRGLNEEKVADYLADTFEDKRATFYQDILRLPPGHSLTISRQGTYLRSYWALDASREVRLDSDDEYADALREIFTEAVKCRLRSAKRVGLLLSGGLDSSSIACVARNLLARDSRTALPTFSAVFDETPECDERCYIETVLAGDGFEPHYVSADQLGPFAHLESILQQKQEPPIGPNLYMLWEMRSAAKRQGVGILLDGIDGDGTVSHGYGYLGELGHARRWLALASELRALNRRLGTSYLRSLRTYGRRYALNPLLSRFRVFAGGRWLAQTALGGPVKRANSGEAPGWCAHLNPEFARRLNLAERRRAGQGLAASAARSEREWHEHVVTQGGQSSLLEECADSAAAFSLEPRHPFWDKRLVEFCLALPPEQKLHHGWSRLVMRRAMEGILPPQIQWRGGKTDLAPALRHSLVGVDRTSLEKFLQGNTRVEQQYLDIDGLRRTYERFVQCERVIAPLEMFAFVKNISLAAWLRLFWPEA
jgi:asparagine synthase (glutamine-hydrolysing)